MPAKLTMPALLAATTIMTAACQPASAPESAAAATPPTPPESPAPQSDRFKLYKTQNMYTFLQLDTRSGKIWQLRYSVEEKIPRGTVPLSTDALADGPDGRFALTATDNMWNFILLDTVDGRTWQCQYSLNEQARGCIPIDGSHDAG